MPSRRRQEATPYNHPKWPAIRAAVLKRDRHTCQIRGPRCKTKATDADHIVPWRDGGAWFDPDNLRASCSPCNISRASHQKHWQGWLRSDTDIVTVDRGTPFRPDRSDVVLDVDRLIAAVAPNPDLVFPEHRTVADVAWHKLIAELRRGEIPAQRVWLVVEPGTAGDYPSHSHIGGDPLDASSQEDRSSEEENHELDRQDTGLY